MDVYHGAWKTGSVCGISIDAIGDRVTGIIVRDRDGSANYGMLFQQITEESGGRLQTNTPAARLPRITSFDDERERALLRRWVETLVENRSAEGEDPSKRFVVYDAADPKEFVLSGEKSVEIDGCGCGAIDFVDVDDQGFIRQVSLRVSRVVSEQKLFTPMKKQTREEIKREGGELGARLSLRGATGRGATGRNAARSPVAVR